jgi:hypothetical protein
VREIFMDPDRDDSYRPRTRKNTLASSVSVSRHNAVATEQHADFGE